MHQVVNLHWMFFWQWYIAGINYLEWNLTELKVNVSSRTPFKKVYNMLYISSFLLSSTDLFFLTWHEYNKESVESNKVLSGNHQWRHHLSQTEPRSQGACWIAGKSTFALPLDTGGTSWERGCGVFHKKTKNNQYIIYLTTDNKHGDCPSTPPSARPVPHMIKNKNLFF